MCGTTFSQIVLDHFTPLTCYGKQPYPVRMTERRKEEIVVRSESGDLEVIDLLTGEVIINSAKQEVGKTLYSFDYAKAMYICELVRQGNTLASISKLKGMPPLEIIAHWQRSDRMFAEELKLARKQRGEAYHDKVIDLAHDAAIANKDQVSGISAAINAFKWAAERNLPEQYGNKVVHEGNAEKPIVMRVINTGINRTARPEIVEVVEKGAAREQATTSREDEEGESASP